MIAKRKAIRQSRTACKTATAPWIGPVKGTLASLVFFWLRFRREGPLALLVLRLLMLLVLGSTLAVGKTSCVSRVYSGLEFSKKSKPPRSLAQLRRWRSSTSPIVGYVEKCFSRFIDEAEQDPRTGRIVGTADYVSPEQIHSPTEVTSVSDIYSLGCTLYYALSAKVPFLGGTTKDKARRHLEETSWHPRRFNPEVSEEFVEVIADMGRLVTSTTNRTTKPNARPCRTSGRSWAGRPFIRARPSSGTRRWPRRSHSART